MNLFTSLLTTVVIAGAVWGAVLMQPVMAEGSSDRQASKSTEKAPITLTVTQKTQDKGKTYIRSVVSQSISLDKVATLWVEFEDKLTQQANLPTTLHQLVVVYQDIDRDFTHATVTIGFPVEASARIEGDIELTSDAHEQQLLSRRNNSEAEMVSAWEEINFYKPVNMVIETYYLDALGREESNQLVVQYK
ncbi:hypothetical protein [Vibrio sp. WXL103]|uniref:hypothetical protein n=1 Tax=Vibrio sp. WXL103 TaxID=3450710 RepID=UPI003EC585E2